MSSQFLWPLTWENNHVRVHLFLPQHLHIAFLDVTYIINNVVTFAFITESTHHTNADMPSRGELKSHCATVSICNCQDNTWQWQHSHMYEPLSAVLIRHIHNLAKLSQCIALQFYCCWSARRCYRLLHCKDSSRSADDHYGHTQQRPKQSSTTMASHTLSP